MATSNDDGDEEGGAATADRLEHEIEEIQEDLEGKVIEIAHRRRAVTDAVKRARRRPWTLVAGGVALVGAVVVALVLRRRRARPLGRSVAARLARRMFAS